MTTSVFLDSYIHDLAADPSAEVCGREARLRLVQWLRARQGWHNPAVFRNLLHSVYTGQMMATGISSAPGLALELLQRWDGRAATSPP